ncbi:hypothetical protein V8F06_007505 [Rhypophila decipiens]
MSSNALTTFTRFNDFPAEIRDMIWAEAIQPGGVENNPLEVYLRQLKSNDRTRPGTKPSDLLQVVFPSTWPPCHPRFIVPRACKEAWAVNLLLYPHCVKVYPRKLEIDTCSQHPDPLRAMRFNGARAVHHLPGSTPCAGAQDRDSHQLRVMMPVPMMSDPEFYWYDDGRNIARLLPFFPSLRRVVWGFRLGSISLDNPLWICGNSVADVMPENVMSETAPFHTHQLVPLAQAIKAGWHDWRVSLGQKGAAPELVQNGDRFVRRCTVACRHCGWKHEVHGQPEEQDVFDLEPV